MQVQGERSFVAPANQSTAFDWQTLRSRPASVSLAMAAPPECLPTAQLWSQSFPLDAGAEEQLCFAGGPHDAPPGRVLLACRVDHPGTQGAQLQRCHIT